VDSGRIVLLNGTPGSGKTSVAVELQRVLHRDFGQPWLTLHIDEFMLMSLKRFAGRDFGFHHDHHDDGTTSMAIHHAVRPLVDGVVHSAVGCARAGLDVIADSLLFDEATARLWETQLRDLWHLRVGLRCPLATLVPRAEQREREGGPPAGLSRYYNDIVHSHARYDVEIDTSVVDVPTAARQLAARIAGGSPPT
jgi:chloramphenicol 3-O phosphotransferase